MSVPRSACVDELYTCEVCARQFATVCGLNNHMKFHEKDIHQTCDVCQMTVVGSRQFRDHQQLHNTLKEFRCLYCSKAFSRELERENHQNQHLAKMHIYKNCKANGFYQCEYCMENFSTVDDINEHTLNHPTDKPYQCTKCDKNVVTIEELREHYVKCLKCSACGKKFKHAYRYANHVQLHTDSCSVCHQQFSNKYELFRHKHIHEKPFQCTRCSVSFAQLNAFEGHVCNPNEIKNNVTKGE